MIEKCEKQTGYQFDSIYDIHPRQRAAFHIWLVQKHKLRTILVDNDSRHDELGMVTGFLWEDYEEWYAQWNGIVLLPSFSCKSLKRHLTIKDCDAYLFDEDGCLNQEYSIEIMNIRNGLLDLMLYPFRHEQVSIGRNHYTWYNTEKALIRLNDLKDSKPNIIDLFDMMRDRAIDVSNVLLEEHYRYKKGQA